MVAGELTFGVGHQSALMRPQLTNEVHEVVKGIALDVELHRRPIDEQAMQVAHVAGTDVPGIGPRVHRDAVGAGVQAQGSRAQHVRNAELARVAHQGHLVEIHRKSGSGRGIGHKACKSIISCRVRSTLTPQW
jgi:hypothetical protein